MSGLTRWMFWMVWENCETPSGMNSSPDHLSAVLLDDLADPFGRDLAEIVVGGDRVDLLAVLLHHPGDQGGELLFRHGAGDDHVGVADAALVLVVVEGEAVELVDDRPVGLTRGAGEAGEDDVHLVALEHAAHHFLIAGIVGLGVVDDQLDLAPGDAAGLVDLLGGQLDAVDLRQRGGGELTGLVFQDADFHRALRQGGGCQSQGGDGERAQETPTQETSIDRRRHVNLTCHYVLSC